MFDPTPATPALEFSDASDPPNAPNRFLLLPAELRVRVYNFLASPRAPSKDYAGFYFTCKQIRQELEEEYVKGFAKSFNAINASWPTPGSLQIESGMPQTIADTQNLIINTPLESMITKGSASFQITSALRPLLCLHVQHMSLRFKRTSNVSLLLLVAMWCSGIGRNPAVHPWICVGSFRVVMLQFEDDTSV
ncbi:hypothetical protein N0V90_008721 [Kalmusia sp. IMI 367209]|nr:hypothetical protein N0V90_008721 [Kalmusia sp. IMI 367209]